MTPTTVWTKDEAERRLAADPNAAAAQVDKFVRVPLTDDQRGALASFVFNLGAGSLAGSTLLKLLNAGDCEGAAIQFGRWVCVTVNGVRTQLPGLVARRAAEAALFRWQTAQAQMVAAPASWTLLPHPVNPGNIPLRASISRYKATAIVNINRI